MSDAVESAEPKPTPTRAVRVTFFEDRAEVMRSAAVPVAAGITQVTLSGVSPYVDERSVQARAVTEGVRVLSAKVVWRAHLERALGREEIDALDQEAKRAARALGEADLALDRAARAEWRAKSLTLKWFEGVGAVPRGAREQEVLASWRGALDALDRSALSALEQAAAAREAKQKASDELERARARLAEGMAEKPRYEALIEVQLEREAAGEAALEVTYRVPCALWRPEHVVRLGDAKGSAKSTPLEIATVATAWQRTGEAWDEVEVRFSTARPAKAAAPPLLSDDTLSARRKTDQERSRIEVDLREQAVMVAGLDRGTRAVDEMPGVDDGGEPVQLTARDKVSIASDGQPFRVEVGRCTLDAVVERVLFPEVAPVAHIRATATLTSGGPLLAGPLRLVRGQSLVGRAKIGYVGKGEPFEVGLGTDDGVRVRRTVTEQRDTTALTGTQKIRRLVRVYLSNLSNERKKVLVTERVPVSEIDDVEISVLEAGGFRLDTKDGFLKREAEIGGQATETLEFAYEIKAAAKVVLPV